MVLLWRDEDFDREGVAHAGEVRFKPFRTSDAALRIVNKTEQGGAVGSRGIPLHVGGDLLRQFFGRQAGPRFFRDDG